VHGTGVEPHGVAHRAQGGLGIGRQIDPDDNGLVRDQGGQLGEGDRRRRAVGMERPGQRLPIRHAVSPARDRALDADGPLGGRRHIAVNARRRDEAITDEDATGLADGGWLTSRREQGARGGARPLMTSGGQVHRLRSSTIYSVSAGLAVQATVWPVWRVPIRHDESAQRS